VTFRGERAVTEEYLSIEQAVLDLVLLSR
jgi:hypothetical protein